jgi:hypothetical protein
MWVDEALLMAVDMAARICFAVLTATPLSEGVGVGVGVGVDGGGVWAALGEFDWLQPASSAIPTTPAVAIVAGRLKKFIVNPSAVSAEPGQTAHGKIGRILAGPPAPGGQRRSKGLKGGRG